MWCRYRGVTDEPIAVADGVPQKEFSISRKGYNPAEVGEYLAEVDVAFRELEEYAARLKHELAEARAEISRLEASEQAAIDSAMLAVFDAKERVMERARLKAQEIVDEARAATGIEPDDGGSSASTVARDVERDGLIEVTGRDVEDLETATPSAPKTDEATSAVPAFSDGLGPDEILRQMLREADTIRSQIEAGMATAFDQIDRMQRDAEDRATALLDEARSEASRLRSASKGGEAETATGDRSADEPESGRPSRYSRNSAKLPRIGNDAGVSVLASMNQLRIKLREAEDVARQVQDPPAS
jgi:DivIVA domain-containing protein